MKTPLARYKGVERLPMLTMEGAFMVIAGDRIFTAAFAKKTMHLVDTSPDRDFFQQLFAGLFRIPTQRKWGFCRRRFAPNDKDENYQEC